MTYENILTHTNGRVGIVQLNRPQALNALSRELMGEVLQATLKSTRITGEVDDGL